MSDAALLPTRSARRWQSGLTPRQEKVFEAFAALLIFLVMGGWVDSITVAYTERHADREAAGPTAAPDLTPTRAIDAQLFEPKSSSTAYLNEAALSFLTPLHGISGKVNLATRVPGQTLTDKNYPDEIDAHYTGPGGVEIDQPNLTTPSQPGLYKLAIKMDQASRAVDDLNIVSLVPFAEKEKGRIGLYYLGSWPFEGGGAPRSRAYANPSGFIEVTPENRNTMVSAHFRLGDFITKGQSDVWPKYLLLEPRLLDKLELVIADLEAHGHRISHVQVMSGFRTPGYNKSGGNTAGRANLSRHMYGDASDVFVDNDRNGVMDDLNGDGRVDARDGEVIGAAAERVERANPSLVGGVGIYAACCGHGPFVHIDVRGFRARWRGTGNG